MSVGPQAHRRGRISHETVDVALLRLLEIDGFRDALVHVAHTHSHDGVMEPLSEWTNQVCGVCGAEYADVSVASTMFGSACFQSQLSAACSGVVGVVAHGRHVAGTFPSFLVKSADERPSSERMRAELHVFEQRLRARLSLHQSEPHAPAASFTSHSMEARRWCRRVQAGRGGERGTTSLY